MTRYTEEEFANTVASNAPAWWSVSPTKAGPDWPHQNRAMFFDNELEARVYWTSVPDEELWLWVKGAGWRRVT